MKSFLSEKFNEIKTHLDAVIASRHPAILNLHVRGWVRKFALGIGSRALISLELTAHLQLEPA